MALGARYQPQPAMPPEKSPFETKLPVVGSAAGAWGANASTPISIRIHTTVSTRDVFLVFLMPASFWEQVAVGTSLGSEQNGSVPTGKDNKSPASVKREIFLCTH